MGSQSRFLAPLALLLFTLMQIAAADETPKTTQAVVHKEDGAVLPHKRQEVDRILANPPEDFDALLTAMPFSIYGKDKAGNYVAFCNSGAVDWDVVDTISAEKLSEYMKYVSLIFWRHIDKRPNSVLSVVLDANGFSMGKVISGSARNVLSAIVNGLNETVDYVGYRPGTVFLINAPSFLSPLVKVVAKLSRVQVAFHVLSKPSKWQPVLKEHIGEENLPIEYGGSNKLPLDSSPVVTFIRASVKKIRQKKEAAAKSKL